MRTLRLLSPTLLVTALACASGKGAPAGPVPASGGSSAAVAAEPHTITAADIAAAGVATAYEAVDRLHRTWFRDQLSGKPVAVYGDDNQLLGDAESLRQIPAQDVAELRYLDGRTASLRWPSATGGAIVVVRQR